MSIPVLDLREAEDPSDRTLRAWEHAAVEIGCFSVVNHGIPAAVLERCRTAAEQFHARDLAWKNRYAMPLSLGNKGYVPDDPSPVGNTGAVVRDYASMDFGPELVHDRSAVESILLGPNLWPDIPGLRTAVEDYWAAAGSVAETVSRMFSRLCGLEPDHLARRSSRGCSLLRLLHYPQPARDLDRLPNAHTDYEWFTLIWQSSAGIEFLGRDGRLRPVPATGEAIVVLVGDLLEVLSGGRLESTLHWVRPRSPDRSSLTFFYGPDFAEVVSRAPSVRARGGTHYPPLHAGNHLTALRVRHLAHLRAAVAAGSLQLPFGLPPVNPLKAAKAGRLEAAWNS